mgnify:CR=1 FL=1
MEGADFDALRTASEDFAREKMSAYDASHDFRLVLYLQLIDSFFALNSLWPICIAIC